MMMVRFLLPLFLVLGVLTTVFTPLAETLVSQWFRKDVELRSALIFQSVEYSLAELWEQGKKVDALKRVFDNIARDERVLAVGLCSAEGALLVRSTQWPNNLACPTSLLDAAPSFTAQRLDKGAVLMGRFQLPTEEIPRPSFIVLHDLSFALERENETRVYLIGFLAMLSLLVAIATLVTTRVTVRSWIGKLRTTFSDPSARLSQQKLPREFAPLVREVRQMMRDVKSSHFAVDSIKIDWTPQTLQRLLEQELPDSEIIVVSNREPYIHNDDNGVIRVLRPASGVVTAIEPIIKACRGTWIAHGSGSADRETVDRNDRIAVPPEAPSYTLRRIWLSAEEEKGYYYGLANEGLWPLCHIAFIRPSFREEDWGHYKNANRRFAQAVLQEAKTTNPIVLVQDYHFALLPRLVREKLPDATIITFWHIPWPNPEVFSICPWREEILYGLMGSSVLGFHTQFHCQNFLDSVDRFVESHINRDQSIVTSAGQATFVRPYPVSIAWPPDGLRDVPSADTCRRTVRERFHLPDDVRIGIGVERFDYTKGITDRFLAVRELLRAHPEWRGRLVFIQAAAPTRSSLPAYQAIQKEALETAAAVNAEFGNEHYQPILLLNRHHEPTEVFELFRAADFCAVSSLHDGMNLVAKEFVAARDDERGVLVLSTFAGASKELMEALPVNPYDAMGMANAFHRALLMPEEEQKDRMRLLRDMVRENNAFYWAAHMLLDAARIRKRSVLERMCETS